MGAIEGFFWIIRTMRPLDLLDLLLVWAVCYRVLVLIKKTGTIQMLSGLGILAVVYICSIWLELFTFNWLLEKFFANLFVIIVILFQGEIRRALAQMGSNSFLNEIASGQETHVIEEIVQTAYQLAEHGYGALIVIEREIMIDYHIEFGTEVGARFSRELFFSIFHPESPMHDGAVLIREGKIHSAGDFLPLSRNPALDKNLGTRHRAAIGLTEETDAIVIIVSEETRSVGLVQAGHLVLQVEMRSLRKTLYDELGLKFKGAGVGIGGQDSA